MTELLILNQVSKTFTNPEVTALCPTSLTLSVGQRIAIVGRTGCGKSTLLRIIAGVEEPTSGSLQWKTTPVFGHMPQGLGLYDWLTVVDNVALGLRIAKVSKAQARERAYAILTQFGLNSFSHAYPHQLSGGMRSRVAFLRTMLINPTLITLDEPFAALDAITRIELHDWLLGILQTRNQTMILVTHDIEEAVYLADRIIVMSPRPGRFTQQFDVPSTPGSRRTKDGAFYATCQQIHQSLYQCDENQHM
ncbi:ABC transporter ATP-binding protein [Arcanobacterium pinnipediorum]|uniref:ABC transporter ATP-binding protein n=1 Tax=Arcanobacterium pinnipediorum TaxID=1503041 RepID=A0ABY5AKE7_9ACTO|nr:ABC transporter ATP-binding protein [Arcanobacterium pinnipediorum]USR79673.1 ABC transporter ATP-binding protein [Arcanobacterium pinnipediorum]